MDSRHLFAAVLLAALWASSAAALTNTPTRTHTLTMTPTSTPTPTEPPVTCEPPPTPVTPAPDPTRTAVGLPLYLPPVGHSPTPTATADIRDEYVMSHRYQDGFAEITPIAASGESAEGGVCVRWIRTGDADALSDRKAYRAVCRVRDESSDLPGLVVSHTFTRLEDRACVSLKNMDTLSARGGTLVCRGYRFGNSAPTPTPTP